MFTVLIAVHVFGMVASLFALPLAIAMALFGARVSVKLASVGVVLAGIGFTTGVALMMQAPVFSECALLTAYLAAMIAIYGAGFAWGDASKARLLRAKA